MDEQEDE